MSNDVENDRIFKALSNFRRRNILDALKDHPQTTGALCDAFSDLDRCTVMQHLNVLEEADLIIVKREGRERWNYLNPMPIKEIFDRWIGQYAGPTVDRLSRLKGQLEG
ncbi:ArsR family transcriptional regulator [Devosia sp. 17-2-E-8]|nr:ArsR family transcriptional regulator [Devosia sp. 17-2-E-8]